MKGFALAILGVLLVSPPSGRPPIGPLERLKPQVYDLTYEVDLNTLVYRDALNWQNFDLEDTPIIMPLIFQGTYSRIKEDSIRPQIWFDSRPDLSLPQRFRIDEGHPHHTHVANLPIVRFTGSALRWRIDYKVKCFSSRINEVEAAKIPWPREWPKEVADGLQSQMFIESDDPIFAQTVKRWTNGKLRMVPPYLAAKDLVRYCVNELQVAGDGIRRGQHGVVHGLKVTGAKKSALLERGGPNDLVCVCVAILRAANIPARPVIGVYENDRNEEEFIVWAEFYLPHAGWVPFDPNEMRGNGIRQRDVRQPWPGFGTMKDLNERIPLSYHFIPAEMVESPQNPAVWGWDPRPRGAPPAEQRIRMTIVSRGRGVEDPQ